MHAIHTVLLPGTQLELLNVQVRVSRRDETPDADFILEFVDQKPDLRVYVPMSPEAFRSLTQNLSASAAGVAVAPAPKLIVAGNGRNH